MWIVIEVTIRRVANGWIVKPGGLLRHEDDEILVYEDHASLIAGIASFEWDGFEGGVSDNRDKWEKGPK